MADLGKYVYYASGLINYDCKTIEDKPYLLESFLHFCDSYNKITKYYFICHTETNVIHIHFAFYLQSQVCLMTLFNKMRNWFVDKKHDTRDENGIQLEKCTSINGSLRYFLHIDPVSIKDGKQQYSIDDFISNDVENIETIINSKKGEIDAFYLRNCVLDCTNEFDLMNMLGLKVYHRYRYEIQILQENRVMLTEMRRKEKEERFKDGTRELPW